MLTASLEKGHYGFIKEKKINKKETTASQWRKLTFKKENKLFAKIQFSNYTFVYKFLLDEAILPRQNVDVVWAFQ